MRKLFLLLAVAGMCCGMVGCAKMPLRGDYVEEKIPPQISPDSEHGIVYLYRDSAFGGGAISYFIEEDTKVIGLLKSGSYFIHKTKPGKHTYSAETEARSSVTLEVQPNEEYYIEGGVSMGFWAGRPQLTEVTKPVAEKVLPNLKYLRLSTKEEAERYKQEEKEKNSNYKLMHSTGM